MAGKEGEPPRGDALCFGPVPSRRLGRSLGINNIRPKSCSYACVYCQVGRTAELVAERRAFFPPGEIVGEVEKRVREVRERGEATDYLAFVPDGEPTLDVHLGQEITALRRLGLPRRGALQRVPHRPQRRPVRPPARGLGVPQNRCRARGRLAPNQPSARPSSPRRAARGRAAVLAAPRGHARDRDDARGRAQRRRRPPRELTAGRHGPGWVSCPPPRTSRPRRAGGGGGSRGARHPGPGVPSKKATASGSG